MESVIASLPSISRVVDRHSREIMDLNIPSIQDLKLYDEISTKSPFVNKFHLKLAYDDLIKMKSKVSSFSKKRQYHEVSRKIDDLLGIIDEKMYVNQKLIDNRQERSEGEHKPTQNAEVSSGTSQVVLDEDNLTSLRQRLLSNGKSSTLLDDRQDNINSQHDSFQSEIINDLSDLSKVLKDSALKFSSKLFEDTKSLSETEQAMMKNSTYMNKVSGNLNDYLLNKSGNTISLWWLLKVSVAIFFTFIFIMIIIKIFPHM